MAEQPLIVQLRILQCVQSASRVPHIGGEYALVTLFVPSLIACFASSPGKINLTAVCTSREESVDFLLYAASSRHHRSA